MTYQHNDFSPPHRQAATLRPDYTTYDGARALIERIKAAWAHKGLPPPSLEIVSVTGGGSGADFVYTRFDVRSDMRNGWPHQEGARP